MHQLSIAKKVALKTSAVATAGILILAYAAALILLYWQFFDNRPIVKIIYTHPHFLKGEAKNREEAKLLEIYNAKAGDTVYRYVEYQVLRSVSCVIKRRWENGFVYPLVSVPNIGHTGKHIKSFALMVPPIKGHIVEFEQELECELNPIKKVKYISTPLKIYVLP